MSFANHNILDIALSLIPPTLVQIRKNLGTTVNKYGQVEATYGEWIEVYGIVQPGSEQNEHTQGIDFSKKTVTIWLRGIALDGTHLQWAPDQIRYTDRIFNVTNVTDWFPYDNYRQCECVEALNLDDSQRAAVRKPMRKTAKKTSISQATYPIVPDSTESENTPIPAEPSSPMSQSVPPSGSLVGKALIKF